MMKPPTTAKTPLTGKLHLSDAISAQKPFTNFESKLMYRIHWQKCMQRHEPFVTYTCFKQLDLDSVSTTEYNRVEF